MAIFLILIASLFVTLSNFCMRKSIDCGGTTKGFLVFQMGLGLLVAILLNPVKTGNYTFHSSTVLFGLFVGVVFAAMLFSLGRALEKGPPGLTFSVLNASTVVPGIVMASLFGAAMGYPYTLWHGIGSCIVLWGLFWAGKGMAGLQDKKQWIGFVFAMFVSHALILVLFQYRALLLNLAHPEELLSLFTKETIQSQWFMPAMFFASALVQLILFLYFEKRWPKKEETFYGTMGGVANGLCTYFMIWSTEAATPLEHAVIFPIFSVMAIILSNLWGQKLYQEQVNWKACQLCAFGLVISTVDWKTVATAIGF